MTNQLEDFPPKQGESGLSRIRKGPANKPPRIILYGTPGIGKSTFAAGCPAPIFIPTEDGLDTLDVHAFPIPKNLEDVKLNLTEILYEDHGYQTVVIDTCSALERFVWRFVCAEKGKPNIEDIGYARGYTYAIDHWREILSLLDAIREKRGMIPLLLAHAKVERFEDPENPSYDRYSLRLHKHADALLTEWADAVLFATRKVRIQKEEEGFGNKRAIAQPVGKAGGDRVIRTTGSPTCVAKNRYGVTEEIPLAWSSFQELLSSRL